MTKACGLRDLPAKRPRSEAPVGRQAHAEEQVQRRADVLNEHQAGLAQAARSRSSDPEGAITAAA